MTSHSIFLIKNIVVNSVFVGKKKFAHPKRMQRYALSFNTNINDFPHPLVFLFIKCIKNSSL